MSQKNIQPFDLCSEPDWSALFGQSYKIMLLNDDSLLGVDLEGNDKTTPTYLECYPEVLGSCVRGLVRVESEHIEGLSSSTTLPVSVESLQTTLGKAISGLGLVKGQLVDSEAPSFDIPTPGEVPFINQDSGESAQPTINILEQEISFLGLPTWMVEDIQNRTEVKTIGELIKISIGDFRAMMEKAFKPPSLKKLKEALAKHGLAMPQ
jgi:hypothetical protein